MINYSFWIDRINKHGHTGWANKVIYYYDQEVRLHLVETIIRKYFSNKLENSLDYGCGSGDFSILLSNYCKKVYSVDIHKDIIKNININNKKENIFYDIIDIENKLNRNKYDIINSITVMQHIIDDKELLKVLNFFNKTLSQDGIIIFIESFNISKKNNINAQSYINLRDFQDFENKIEEAHLKIIEKYNLYHPNTMPTALFKLYNNIFIKVINRLSLHSITRYCAKQISSYDNIIRVEESPTKLIIVARK